MGNRDVDATGGGSARRLVDVIGLAVAFPIAALVATGCDSNSARTDLQDLSLWAVDTNVEAADRSFAEVDLDPEFRRRQRAYSVTVGYGVERLFVLASALDENASFEVLAVMQDGTKKPLGSSSTAERFSFSASSIRIGVVESADGERKTRTSVENQKTSRTVDGADLSGLLEQDADARWVLEPLAVGSNMLEIEATGLDGEPARPYVINVVRSEPDLTDPGVRERYFKDSLIRLDLEGVRRAVDAGADINQPLEETDVVPAGTTPLLLALAQGQDAVVALLIERDADVDAIVPVPDPKPGPEGAIVFDPPYRWPSKLILPGMTALLLAINNGMEQSVGLLLEAQADPNRPLPLVEASVHSGTSGEVSGASPIMLAVSKGHDDIARQVIDHGADVNYAIPVRDGESGPDGTVIYKPPFYEPSKVFVPGLTALLLAVIGNREESVRLLLEAGADPNKAFPLTVASVHDPAAEKVSGVSPLIAAAGIENTVIVRTLIEAGAHVDYEVPEHPRTGGIHGNDTTGASALKVARARGNDENVRILEQAKK